MADRGIRARGRIDESGLAEQLHAGGDRRLPQRTLHAGKLMMWPHPARAWSRRFVRDRSGSSIVEFALLLPLMMTMYFGSIQVTDAISADRQVTLAASTVAEITSQYSQVATSDVTNILTAAASVMAPFSFTSANATVTLSSIIVDGNGNATIAWSRCLNGTARSGTV